MSVPERSELKTGKRPVQMNIKAFKPGEVLFEEDSKGREMFVVQEGKVGVYKNTSDGEIQLAFLEKGAVVGEMSLLDDLPRSATVRAVEETKVLVINEGVFKATLCKTPVWLTSIIKIVVNRLRDANKRVDQTALRDKERGVVSLIRLLLSKYQHTFSSKVALNYDLVIVEAYYVCRLRKKDIIKIISGLEERELIDIEEDDEHKKHICVNDYEALELFNEYLILKSQKKKFREILVPEESIAMLSNIAYVAQKSGTATEDGIVLSKVALLEDLSGEKSDLIEKQLLELRRRGLINILPTANDVSIIFRQETVSRIKKIKEWLPRFEKEIA